jgi:hypothetical protein
MRTISKDTKLAEAKAPYDKPVLRQYGSVEKITKGLRFGTFLDADFPAGTHIQDLTFS